MTRNEELTKLEVLELRVLMVREMIVETLNMLEEAGLGEGEKMRLVGILAGARKKEGGNHA